MGKIEDKELDIPEVGKMVVVRGMGAIADNLKNVGAGNVMSETAGMIEKKVECVGIVMLGFVGAMAVMFCRR